MEYYAKVIFLYSVIGVVLTQETSNSTHVTVGVIVDAERTVLDQRQTDVNVTCNVSVVWQYVNYSEIFHMFRAVRQFDMDDAVDVIILTDYTPTLWSDNAILEANNNSRMLRLLKTMSFIVENIFSVRQFDMNDTVDVIVLTDYTPTLWSDNAILEPNSKRMLRLLKSTTSETNEILLNITNQYVNGSGVPNVGSNSEPVCKEIANASSVSSSSILMSATAHTAPSGILARLVRLQKWKTIHVFYDTSTEQETQLFVDALSSYGIAFSLYNVDAVTSIHDLLVHAYDAAVIVKPEINFAVICRLECMIRVFHAANQFDHLNVENQSLMTLFSRWLAVIYNYNPLAAHVLKTVANQLSNVAIVVVPEFQSIPPHRLNAFLKLSAKEASTLFVDGANNKQLLMESIQTSLITSDPASTCGGYIIKTLLWRETGRDFSDVGHASLDTSLHLLSELFPNIKYGYSKRRFKIVTIPYPPFVIEQYNNGTKKFVGVCMDLLEELSRILNFTYTLVGSVDGMWGSPDRVENDTYVFNGMIGMLQRHEVEISAAPLAIIPVREMVTDFSYPIYHEYTTVVLKKPDPNVYKWRTLLDPFKINVLLFIGVALIGVTAVIYFMERYNAFYMVPANAAVREELGGLHTVIDSFWYIYGALLCQGGVHLPDSFAGRTLISGWWIFCIVIVGTYCGNLIAFLTVSKDVTPFNNLEEMAEMKGEYEWGTLGGTNWEHVFTTSELPDFRKIGDAMIEFNESDPGTFHIATSHHIDRVKEGGYAYIGDVTTVELVMSTECDLTRIKEEFLPMKYGFAFQQRSPHTAIFSEQIMKSQEAGLFAIWRRKWWPKKNFCLTGNQPTATPITLSDVQSAHYVCALGFVVGTIAFITEVVIFRCRQNRDGGKTTENEPGVKLSNSRAVLSDNEISETL